MPLTAKGSEIMANMTKPLRGQKKGKQVFYASRNAGKISGVDRQRSRRLNYKRTSTPSIAIHDDTPRISQSSRALSCGRGRSAVVATDSPMSVQKYIARTLPMFPELDGRDYFSYSGGMTWIDTEAAIRDILRANIVTG